MTILALDTSGPSCSVAVSQEQQLLYEARAVNKLTHSRSLMPMVEEALNKSGRALGDIGLIAAVVGPGSFTGVRIGVAAAQGIARGLGIRCVPVNALEAMARNVWGPGGVVCTIRDARAGQVYGAAFMNGTRLIPDSAMMLGDFLDTVSPLGTPLVFLGDGLAVGRGLITDRLGSRALFVPAHLVLPGAASAAGIAFEHMNSAVEPGQLLPLYLRAPQAERLRAQKDGRA